MFGEPALIPPVSTETGNPTMNPSPVLPVTRPSALRLLAAALFSGFAVAAPAQVYEVPVRETADSGPSLGPSGRPPPSSANIYSAEPNRVVQPPIDAYFLPPLLPVVGVAAPAPRKPLVRNYPREAVGEPFFMAYGNLAAQNLLSDQRADRLVSYRTARQTLLTELHVELERGPEVAAEARARALAGLAAIQTPRLLELEAEAEQIRHELTHTGILKPAADDIGNLVPTDEKPELKDVLADIRMILSAAHFRAGFSSDQRRLLEEMAQEIRLTIEPEPIGSPIGVFFWPAGARIPMPSGLPPEAAGRFAEFQQRKAALKDELRAALERDRRQLFNIDNTPTFERLAAAQAPRFAELDTLADQIRPALATLSAAGDRLVTGIPADLAQQIISLADRTAALQGELRDRLAEFRTRLPDDRLALTPRGDGLAITVETNHATPGNRELVLAHLNEFNDELAARFTALAAVRDRVRDAITRYLAKAPGAKPGQTPDRFAADFLAAHRAGEYLNRQRDYAAAVFAPGLSPAQRRLLLAAAATDSLQ